MEDAISIDGPVCEPHRTRVRRLASVCAPTRVELGLSVLSAALLVVAFPDFDLWPLAWIALVPLFVAVGNRPSRGLAFVLGWITGSLFFYASCYWLTHAMIRYGDIPAWAAYLLLIPGPVIAGLFPAMCMMVVARAIARWGMRALFLAPVLWATFEWFRLGAIGQLWNAIGYAQAYAPALIQPARWGGVYLVGSLIVLVNAAFAYAFLERNRNAYAKACIAIFVTAIVMLVAYISAPAMRTYPPLEKPDAIVVAVQPNVPMDPIGSVAEMNALLERHYSLSETGISQKQRTDGVPLVVIWPESPMNFKYAGDSQFQALIAEFASKHNASVMFNSQEPAPANGTYNSAVIVNEKGSLVAQYDKIRLLPFGEYVPLPGWIPGASAIPAMVGNFTHGERYTLMPLGSARTGVFICFESAFPYIARRFTREGADVLVNISNDGYLGQTPVMRQHLANVVFRAVENDRPVLRVTNTGITAYVTERGEVLDATPGFQTAVRSWSVYRATGGETFYTKYGDVFVWLCTALSVFIVAISWKRTRA